MSNSARFLWYRTVISFKSPCLVLQSHCPSMLQPAVLILSSYSDFHLFWLPWWWQHKHLQRMSYFPWKKSISLCTSGLQKCLMQLWPHGKLVWWVIKHKSPSGSKVMSVPLREHFVLFFSILRTTLCFLVRPNQGYHLWRVFGNQKNYL